VVVDGKRQQSAGGRTTLWADGACFRAVRASAPALIGGKQFERTVALVDVGTRDFYVADIFRVAGGKDHAKFVHSHFGCVATTGLSLRAGAAYGEGTLMRKFHCDASPRLPWRADWTIEDRYGYLPAGTEVRLRYTDFTRDAQACTAEGWIVSGSFDSVRETWIPRLMIRREAQEAPLVSAFVSVLEPYSVHPPIAQARRVPLAGEGGAELPDTHVALEFTFGDGRSDYLVARDVENPRALCPAVAEDGTITQHQWGLRFEGDPCLVRRRPAGAIERIAVCGAMSLRVGGVSLILKRGVSFLELAFPAAGQPKVAAGKPEYVKELTINGRRVKPE
jgi:hypothetical protein